MRLKTFDVYLHPTRSPKAIKRGISWPGFFFGGFWLIYNRLWFRLLVIFGFLVAISVGEVILEDQVEIDTRVLDTFISLLIAVHVSGNGYNWLRRRLEKRGYSCLATLKAESKWAAIRHSSPLLLHAEEEPVANHAF